MEFVLYIIFLAIIAVITCIGFIIVNKKNQILPGKQAVLYYLFISIVIALGGFTALLPPFAHSMGFYFLMQMAYLGLGFLAGLVFRKNVLGDFNSGNFSGIFFILSNAFLGMIGFVIIYNYLDPIGIAPYYSLCIIPFVLPVFLQKAFEFYQRIPQDIFKIWHFPLHADEIDFEDIDTNTIFMLELEYSKSIDDPRLINTKLRAPVNMIFGDWFRSFIENYNYKYDNDPIHFLDQQQQPQGWMFYVKPSLLGKAKFIDPDRSITDNQIIEKNIIIAKRVGIVHEPE